MARERSHVTVCTVGHFGGGKSTVTGRLLVATGTGREMAARDEGGGGVRVPGDDNSKESSGEEQRDDIRAPTVNYAWVMDSTTLEREVGHSVHVARRQLTTSRHDVTLLDVPGAPRYGKAVTVSVSQADCALVVADVHEMASDAARGGLASTRQHALTAYTLGVKQVICAVNKMDASESPYSETRYEDVMKTMGQFFKNLGFQAAKVTFVPVSGLHGDNVVKPSPNMAWYKGPTLLQAIDKLEPLKPPANSQPLRFTVQDVIDVPEVGTVAIGRVATGTLALGQRIALAAPSVVAEVRGIQLHHRALTEAGPGDSVGVHLANVELSQLRRGQVMSDADRDPVREVHELIAQVIVLNHPTRIFPGYTPTLCCHTGYVACRFAELHARIDRKTGQVVDKRPQSLQNGDAAFVRLVPLGPLCVEAFVQCAMLGRFVLRDNQQTVAVGMVKSVTHKR